MAAHRKSDRRCAYLLRDVADLDQRRDDLRAEWLRKRGDPSRYDL
jgi:hypothetical protein